MNISDFIITFSYFSIPIQILFSLYKYPKLARMPTKITILLVLFALFIFLCGTGHLFRCLDMADTGTFAMLNTLTAVVSLATALYLLPLIPNLLGTLDSSLNDLVQMNAEITESKSKLFTFIAFLCHEIRNPLFAITSAASFLGDTDMTEEQETGVGSIFDSALLMLRLVNDVLDLSKIDAGKLQLENHNFDLHLLLLNLERNMRVQIQLNHSSEVKFNFNVADEVPRLVHGDSVRLLQIIYNLLSNASKFTEKGQIDVRVAVCDNTAKKEEEGTKNNAVRGGGETWHSYVEEVEHGCTNGNTFSMRLLDAAEQGQLCSSSGTLCHTEHTASETPDLPTVILSITVSDTGTGIPPERIQTIFEPYSQSKLSDYRKHGGTGLGLSILCSIIKLMGGTIALTSHLGEGTKFHLKLPVRVLVPKVDGSSVEMEDGVMDMTDPFLTCRRLPVYSANNDEGRKGNQTREPPRRQMSLHHENAGINFFTKSDQQKDAKELTSNFEGAPQPLSAPTPPPNTKKQINKQKSKRPRLPSFDFPPGDAVVLVVDDNAVNRKIIRRMLSFYSVECQEAVDGLEAVHAIRSSRNVTGDPNALQFGLVFMDLSMPVMDGYDAIKMLRGDGVSVPIVALTANSMSQEQTKVLALGANEFHTKPILRDEVHALCARFLTPLMRPSSMSQQEVGVMGTGNSRKGEHGESHFGGTGSLSCGAAVRCRSSSERLSEIEDGVALEMHPLNP